MGWGPCLSHEHPNLWSPRPPTSIRHPGHDLPAQPLASCGKAHTQDIFPPAELMRVNAFACSEFPGILTLSQVQNLSTNLLPLKKKKKNPNSGPRKKAGRKEWAESLNSAVHCCLRQRVSEMYTQAHIPKPPGSPLAQELNPPAERLNSGGLGSLMVCPHLQQRKLEEKATEAPFHPEMISLSCLLLSSLFLAWSGLISMLRLLSRLIKGKTPRSRRRGHSEATLPGHPSPRWPSFQSSESSLPRTRVVATKQVPSESDELNCPPRSLSSICLVITDCIILGCPNLRHLDQHVHRHTKHSQAARLVRSPGPASSASGAGCT